TLIGALLAPTARHQISLTGHGIVLVATVADWNLGPPWEATRNPSAPFGTSRGLQGRERCHFLGTNGRTQSQADPQACIESRARSVGEKESAATNSVSCSR